LHAYFFDRANQALTLEQLTAVELFLNRDKDKQETTALMNLSDDLVNCNRAAVLDANELRALSLRAAKLGIELSWSAA
jgi:hypothetical protein